MSGYKTSSLTTSYEKKNTFPVCDTHSWAFTRAKVSLAGAIFSYQNDYNLLIEIRADKVRLYIDNTKVHSPSIALKN